MNFPFRLTLPLYITTKKIIYPLLQQLSQSEAAGTIKLLIELAPMLGQIIQDHYIPFIRNLIQTNMLKTTKNDTVFISALSIIDGLVPLSSPQASKFSFN